MVNIMVVLAQFFRIISAVFEILADKDSDKKRIFFYNGIYNGFCAIQYFLLNAMTGGICSILAILRNFLLMYCDKKYLYFILPIYFTSLYLINYSSYDGFLSYLPVFMVIMYTCALFVGNIYGIKITVIVCVLLEIIYDLYYGAYMGMIICVIDAIFVIISLFKMKKSQL